MNAKDSVKQLLVLMGYPEAKVNQLTNDNQIIINISVSDDQAGALIGQQGETISALQTILNLVLNHGAENWSRYIIDIGDYRKDRESSLEILAKKAADNAKSTGKEVILSYLPSHERRVVHLYLEKDSEVETYSEGVGKFRRLVIKPVSPK